MQSNGLLTSMPVVGCNKYSHSMPLEVVASLNVTTYDVVDGFLLAPRVSRRTATFVANINYKDEKHFFIQKKKKKKKRQ